MKNCFTCIGNEPFGGRTLDNHQMMQENMNLLNKVLTQAQQIKQLTAERDALKKELDESNRVILCMSRSAVDSALSLLHRFGFSGQEAEEALWEDA